MARSSNNGRSARALGALLLGAMLAGAAPVQESDPDLRCSAQAPALSVNDLQYVTAHNAFHVAPDQALLAFALAERTRQGASAAAIAKERIAADYSHPTLTRQLGMGIRALEIDVHDDPLGGRFQAPRIFAAMPPAAVRALPPFDPARDLARPGFKTFHETSYDMRSHCLLFGDCLREVGQWHRAHPGHLPIFVLLEMKADAEPPPAGADAGLVWKRLQDSIGAQFAPDEVILPAQLGFGPVRWPTLAAARGKLVFLLFPYGDHPVERYARYIAASGDRPLLHVERDVEGLHATWQSRNDPATIAADATKGRPAPAPGLLLYTKADTTGVQDPDRRNLALSSRANFVATDYELPDPRRSGYGVSFAGRYVRAICAAREARTATQ